MKVLKARMIKLYPTKHQKHVIAVTAGCVRFVWNQMLGMQNVRHELGCKYTSANAMKNMLPAMKLEHEWLNEADSTALQYSCEKLDKAFKDYFDPKQDKKHPVFKKKRYAVSYKTKMGLQIVDAHHIKIAKLGTVKYRGTLLDGRIVSATIEQHADGKYYASVLFETEVDELPETHELCGGDLGLRDLLILDDGTKFDNPRFDRELDDRLKYWQRKASRRLLKAKEAIEDDKRRQKKDPTVVVRRLTDFKNYQRARRMVASIHQKIANQRYDYLQKLSTELVRKYDVIVLEDLKSSFMLKNHNLARAIANASWNALVNMIEYKCAWYGKQLIKVNPAYTSQTCNACGCTNNRLEFSRYGWLKVEEWTCPHCGTHLDRDINAAINIKNKGLLLM